MSRKRVLLFLGALLAAIVGFLLCRSDISSPGVATSLRIETADGARPAVELDAPAPVAPAQDPSSPRAALPHDATSAATVVAKTELIVFGRTVDENDRPLSGVVVRLQSHKVWTTGLEVPRLASPHDLRGWEVLTDEHGAFRFEVPPPTVAFTWLTIAPDPFHDSAIVYFGGENPSARPELHLVDSDLGVFRLSTTGAIRGRVTDEDGRGIADVALDLAALQRSGTSDSSGAFLIPHVPPGAHGVSAKCTGYLSQSRTPIEVVAGRLTDPVEFALLVAPSLSGIVVDESGAPLEGVKLWGRPESYGWGAGGKTLANGTFVVSLPQAERYSLTGTLEGYEPFEHLHEGSEFLEPGTSGLRFEMKRSRTWTFRVVDSVTGQPIERFGFTVLLDNGRRGGLSMGHSPPPIQSRPGGVAEVHMRPGIDLVVVAAEAYQDEHIDLEPAPPEDGIVVVRMQRGARVVGRVTSPTVSVAGVVLQLQSGSRRDEGKRDAQGNPELTFRTDRDGALTAPTDANGHFVFEGLDAGDYRLVASPREGRVIHVEPFRLNQGELDLGEIPLGAASSVSGRVLVPSGRSAAGLKIHLDHWPSEHTQVTDAEGRFSFDGLFAGAHTLLLEEVQGAIMDPPPLELSLMPGEERTVVFDASQCGTCHVTLTVLRGESPASNAVIEVVVPMTVAPKRSWRNDARGNPAKFYRLGKTDEHGRVSGWVPALGTARVVLQTESVRGALEHPSVELALTLDARIEHVVRFKLGSLVLELPPGVVIPEHGHLIATLFQSAERQKLQELIGRIDAGTKAGSWTFDDVFAEEVEIEVKLFDANGPQVFVFQEGGISLFQSRPVHESTQSVAIRAGVRNHVRLR